MIRIKLAVLESDENYLERIMTVFSSRFNEKLDVFSFTDPNIAFQTIEKNRIEVFLASEDFKIDTAKLPDRCAFAYFTESNSIDTLYGQRTVCKFQKVELIYREILSLFSEKSGEIIGYKKDDSDTTNVLAFCSSSGGVGSSTAAAAAAIFFAGQNKKVLYLNVEPFGCSRMFFDSEGQYGLSDVLYAIKSKKSNLTLKLEGAVKQDQNGIFFYESCKQALDIEEIKEEDMSRLLDELQISGIYDFIIVDMRLSFSAAARTVLKKARGIVFTMDGSRASQIKTERAFQSLEILDEKNDDVIMKKIHILQNKSNFAQKERLEGFQISVLGCVPDYGMLDHIQAAKRISDTNLFHIFL